MHNDKMATIVIEVDSELLEQLKEIIEPVGLTNEMLIQRLFAWCCISFPFTFLPEKRMIISWNDTYMQFAFLSPGMGQR